MKKLLTLISITILILSSACETVIEVDLPRYTPKIVVNGFFSTNETWRISLSNSVGILETNKPQTIENASVRIISESDEIALEYRPNQSLYINQFRRPIVGKEYTLYVSAPGYEEVRSNNYIPNSASIISFDTTHFMDNEFGFREELIELTFILKDDPDEENFYHLAIFDEPSSNSEGFWFRTDNASIISENEGDLASFSGESAVFNDYLFQGKEYKIKMRIENYDDSDMFIGLTTITKELFQYQKSFDRFSKDFDGPFSEPEPAYSNIENGLGIFAGYKTVFVEVK